MSDQQKLIRIDLAESEIPQPCKRHKKRGYQADCEDCDDTDPIVGEVPEFKGLFVEIKNPNLLPYGETKKLFAIEENETVGQYREKIAAGLITAWNVTDADTGEELPLPTSADRGSLDRAIDVVNPVYLAVLKARKDRAVPKATTKGS
jgi:hypothetical protein